MIISFWNPFAARFVTLRTRLSPEECSRRLQDLTLPWFSTILVIPFVTSTLPLVGWVYPTGFAVRKRSPLAGGYQHEAKASFVAASDGTRLTMRVGPRRWILITSALFLVFLTVYLEGLVLLLRYEGDPRGNGRSALAMPFVIPALFVALQLWCLWKERDEGAFLIGFLKQRLEADEVAITPREGRPLD